MLKFIFSILIVCAFAQSPADDLELNITWPSEGTANMTWSGFSGSGDYTATVHRISNMQQVFYTQTSSTSAQATGLQSGVTYRFTVTQAPDYIIIIDMDAP